jgi:thiamine-phosphate pyrophosphorylase
MTAAGSSAPSGPELELKNPVLIAITDSERRSFDAWLVQLEQLLAEAAPGSVQVLLRDRQLSMRERRALGQRLRLLTAEHGQSLSVNDRLDLAVLLGADAVHLSESSVSVADARAFAAAQGSSWSISRASHQPADAASTEADALLLAPVAEARKGRPALGALGVQRARAGLASRAAGHDSCRLYALGGVSADNAPALVAAGADGVALIGALLAPGAPRALVEALGIQR